MQRPFSLFIALRLIRSKRSNGFLSFISWASMIGLILGVASLIVVTSVMNGFEQVLTNRILGMVAHVSIQSDKPIANWQDLSQQIKNNNDNVHASAPFVMARGMTSIKGNVHGTILNGIAPIEQKKVSILNDIMVEGSLDSLSSANNYIVLGKTLADKNQLKIGDPVTVFIGKPANSVTGIEPILQTFTLGGVFNATEKVNEWLSYVAIDDLNHLLQAEQGVRGIRLSLNNVMIADKTASQVNELINNLDKNNSYRYYHWKQTHGGIYESLRMQKTMVALLLFLIVLVATFNIVSTLIMLITEKTSDIAILKTYGATPKMIAQIFIAQGVIIGVVGALVGTIFGIGISLVLEDISYWLNTTFNLGLFDSYYIDSLTTNIHGIDIFVIICSSIVFSVLATIYPAIKAMKIEPAKELIRK